LAWLASWRHWISQEDVKDRKKMETTKKRALELAALLARSEPPFSKAIDDALQDLREFLKTADPQSKKEVMERIRGFD
jgi:hypothetical protein